MGVVRGQWQGGGRVAVGWFLGVVAAAGVATAIAAAAAAAGVFSAPRPASAAVEHGVGFGGSVDGYRSWYGSYRLGELGQVWCVDHGIAAPDVVLGYVPTALEDRAPETRRAVAWAVGRHGPGADRVTAAALMLVLHDLMGAVYPSGPLSVDRLTEPDLVGFGGSAGEVIARARLIKADAVARAELVGPLALSVEVGGEGVDIAGRTGTLRARLADAGGRPLEGVVVHPAVEGAELSGDVDVVTDADGVARWEFRSGPGENRFALAADVPGAELVALTPTQGAAQRVAVPAEVVVDGSTSMVPRVPRMFTIVKTGDDPTLPVAGAVFSVSGVEGPLVVGDDGRTLPISLLPGTYTVTEVAPPEGYDADGPWEVVVGDADVLLEVTNRARRGELDVVKVDAVTGAVVRGATFAVSADRDADPSTFEVPVADAGVPLLEGRYEVRELEAPPHYRRDAWARVVDVRGGERTEVMVRNQPLATMAFLKHPALAGATFVVSTEGGSEVGQCTTGGDGRCALAADALDAHARYCWAEVVAPAGWGLAEGACVVLGPAGSVATVDVDEPPLPPPPPPSEPEAAPSPPPPAAPAPEEVLAAAAPSAEAAPIPPAETPAVVLAAPPPTRPPLPELPRTGVPVGRTAALGLAAVGAGLLLLAAAGRRPPAA